MAERLSPEALAAIRARQQHVFDTYGPSADGQAADEVILRLLDHVAALEEIVRDVARSGVEFEDPRIGYVTIQLDRETLEQARSFLQEPTP